MILLILILLLILNHFAIKVVLNCVSQAETVVIKEKTKAPIGALELKLNKLLGNYTRPMDDGL